MLRERDITRRVCIATGCEWRKAQATVETLTQRGIGLLLLDEVLGFVSVKQDNTVSLRYIETLAVDWMSQRDPLFRG